MPSTSADLSEPFVLLLWLLACDGLSHSLRGQVMDAMASSAQDISSSHFEAFLLLRSLLGSPHFVMERHEIAAKSGPSRKCEREGGDTLFAFWLVCRQVVT